MPKSASIRTVLVLLCVCFSFSCDCFSQHRANPHPFWSKVRYGGGIGLGFGNGSFNASITPSAIYQASPEFATGVSLNFNYADFDNQSLLAYGGSILTLYNPIQFLQLSGELEQLRVNRDLELDGSSLEGNYWSTGLFFGLGYVQRNVTIGLRYNVLHDDDESIYTDALMPFMRVYF